MIMAILSIVGWQRYQFMEDLLSMDACRSHEAALLAYLCQVTTPYRWRSWDQALRNHPDQRFKDYIVRGL